MNGLPLSRSGNIRLLAALILLPFVVLPLHAQQAEARVDSEVARADLMGRIGEVMAASEGSFAEASPGDDDLGEQYLLSASERYRPLSIYGNVTEFFTSDASLVEDDIGSDWFNLLQVGINYVPQIAGTLYGELTFRQDLYRYARYSELSFNATNLGAGLTYIIPQLGDLALSANYGFTFLTNSSASVQTYHEQFLRFGLQKPFRLTRAQFLFTGLTSQIVLEGTPGFALRDQFYWYAGYQAQITSRLSGSAFYQIGYVPFRENNRADWNQILSGALTYSFLEYFSASASISAGFNNSNDPFFDYSVLNVGAGVTGTLRF